MNLSYPKITYNNVGTTALTYNATSQLFSVNASPLAVSFSSTEGPRPVTGVKSLQIHALVDNTGALVGGLPGGNDLTLSGTLTRVVGNVTNKYSGVLLTGQVVQFGFQHGNDLDQYDFRFTPTGGALVALFANCEISVVLASENSTFAGNFNVNFNGQARGTVGPEDVTPPQIVCPTNITVECQAFANGLAGAYVSFPLPTATDNCDPNPTVTCTPPSGSFFPLPPGVQTTNYPVVCVARDGGGNTNACIFEITVQDTLPPEFADINNPVIQSDLTHPILLTNDTGKSFATFTFAWPLATDNACSTNFETSVSAVDENGAVIPLTDLGNGLLQGQFPVTLTGADVITITANDGHGNTAQHQAAIFVVDNEPPVINCPGDLTVECTNGPVYYEEPVVSDNCPNVTFSCTPASGCVLGIGQYPITCIATDSSGNTNQCVFTLTVQDTTPPVISCPAAVTVECGQSTDPSSAGMATASDLCASTLNVAYSDAISGNCPRIITRTWTATDPSGNSASGTQIITVKDTTPPTIVCPPDKSLQCGDSTGPANTGTATATDGCSTNVTITFTDAPTPANCTGKAGINRTWTATDACGNTATAVQHITFADTTPPVLTCPPDRQLQCGSSTGPANTGTATATDGCNTNVTITFADAPTPANCTGKAGINRTWTATDACGNKATAVQHITFVDTIPPVISCPTNMIVVASACNNTVPANNSAIASFLNGATASDNCSGGVRMTNNAPSSFPLGTNTVTFTATDACGNSASYQVKVIVVSKNSACDFCWFNQPFSWQTCFDRFGGCQYLMFTGCNNFGCGGNQQGNDKNPQGNDSCSGSAKSSCKSNPRWLSRAIASGVKRDSIGAG